MLIFTFLYARSSVRKRASNSSALSTFIFLNFAVHPTPRTKKKSNTVRSGDSNSRISVTPSRIRHKFTRAGLLTMTDIIISQNIDSSSWNTLYSAEWLHNYWTVNCTGCGRKQCPNLKYHSGQDVNTILLTSTGCSFFVPLIVFHSKVHSFRTHNTV
jgi:hypothetical protein